MPPPESFVGSQLQDADSASLVESRRSALDSKIRWHYEQIALLKSERNSIAPIARLPNELISIILDTYARDTNSLSTLMWTRVMLVCRLWYEISIVSHSLWGKIDLGWGPRISRLRTQLERSGTVPLTIRIGSFMTTVHFPHIRDNAHRVEALNLSCLGQDFHSLMADLPLVTFPCLRTLSLLAEQEPVQADDETIPTLPSSIFDGGMPSLTELKLSLVNVPWRSVRNLEILSLTSEPLDQLDQPPFGLLLEMLRSCPRLKDLKLEWSIPPPNEQENHSVVELTHLTTLAITARLERCTALLNRLRFPATTQLFVQPAGLATEADLTDILIPLGQHVRARAAPRAALLSIRCKSLYEADSDEPRMTCLTASLHSGTTIPSFSTPDTICLLMAHPEDDELLHMLTSISDAFPFDTPTHLDIRSAPLLEQEGFHMLLLLLPALEMVYLGNDDGGLEFVLALCKNEHQEEAARAEYPRLQCLSVHPVLRNVGADIDSTIFPMLKLLLEARCANGDPLRVLEVEEDDYFRLTDEEERLIGGMIPLVELGVRVRGVLYDVSTWAAELERREVEVQRFKEQRARMFSDSDDPQNV
ncbi:hypothetical protein C8R43DRAFT_914219 [Mycena crocata]|nr:hypothetical protein C8R43DRAFT_914219 [Mycena crocata]